MKSYCLSGDNLGMVKLPSIVTSIRDRSAGLVSMLKGRKMRAGGDAPRVFTVHGTSNYISLRCCWSMQIWGHILSKLYKGLYKNRGGSEKANDIFSTCSQFKRGKMFNITGIEYSCISKYGTGRRQTNA